MVTPLNNTGSDTANSHRYIFPLPVTWSNYFKMRLTVLALWRSMFKPKCQQWHFIPIWHHVCSFMLVISDPVSSCNFIFTLLVSTKTNFLFWDFSQLKTCSSLLHVFIMLTHFIFPPIFFFFLYLQQVLLSPTLSYS